MRSRFPLAVLPLFLCFGQLTPYAQQPEKLDPLQVALAASQRRSQLEMPDAEPFHLKATVEIYGADGRVLAKDKLDELWQSPKRYRQEVLLQPSKPGDSAATLLEVDNGTLAWRTGRWSLPGNFIYPVLQPFYLFQRLPQRLSTQPVLAGNTALDCLGTEPQLPNVTSDTPIAVTTYCMEKGNHILRLVDAPNGLQIAYRDVQPFGKKFVARTVDFIVFRKLRMRVRLDALEAATDFSALEQAPPGVAQRLSFHRGELPVATGELFHGQILKSVPALFPKPGGDVVLKCHVTTAEGVDSAEVIQSSNQALNGLAVAAAKQWKFRASYQDSALVPQEVTLRLQGDGESPVFINP